MNVDNVTCNSSHFTSFSGELQFQAQINSPLEASVKDPRPTENSAMAMLLIVAGLFLVSYPIFWCHDEREKNHSENFEVKFWRRKNDVHRLQAEVGTLPLFCLQCCISQHPNMQKLRGV